jgi:hypothetical protein
MKPLLILFLLGTSARAVDFDADIRPLLQERCVECHSETKNKADLRLDAKVHAFRGGESGPAIVAGKAADSPLFQRITSSNEDERMPPKGAPLTPSQVTALKNWIDSGAVWPENATDQAAAKDKRLEHFAFQPLRVATITDPSIDLFIQQKLGEKSLTLSPAADRRTLLRRLHFVVTGLAPTLEDVRAFEKDTDPQAYEKRVDQLLNSRHYGEKWARHWLDVVRFADSNGFETNHERLHAWRYRDYVIDAFNHDKPYDRFMLEQIAGDTVGEDVATGFIVAGPWDRVKGQDKNLQLMQRADELSDMVNATGTTFLGLTLGCAKCHNHKFDPITQTDFYAIQSIFSGVQHGDRPIRPADFEDKQKKIRELEQQLAPLTAKLASFQPKAALGRRILIDDEPAPALAAASDAATGKEILKRANPKPILYDPGTEKGQASDAGTATRFPNLATSYRYFTEAPGTDCFSWEPRTAGRFRLWLSWGAWPTHAPDARYVLDLDGDLKTTDDQKEIAKINQRQFADATPAEPNARRWSGFRAVGTHALTANSRLILRMGDVRAPTVADMILCEEVLEDSPPSATPHLRTPVTHLANTERFDPVTAKFVRFSITATATSGAEPCLDELEIYAVGNAAQNIALAKHGTQARSGGDFPNHAKHKLAHINDGLYGNDHSWIAKQKNTGGWVQLELAQPTAINRVEWSRDRGTKGTVHEDRLALGYRVEVSLDAKAWTTVATSEDRLDTRFRKRGLSLPVASGIPESELAQVETLRRKQAQLTEQLDALTSAPLAYAGRFEQPQPTHRLHRGDFLEPREIVAPDGLSVFRASLGSLNLAPDAPEKTRRAAFAKWLTDKRNPLPARVMVNRLWHYTFGTGIVATPSDFGLMGFRPTHPELLDWLAAEFIRSGWSVKHIQRLILTSATFRQGNAPQPAAMQVDASNTLLWRFPPRRLDAELIRDHILSATGTIDLTPGGPGFLLFEPNANYARNWIAQTRDFEREDYRRMIYALKLRMEPDAIFAAFDVPDGGQVCPSRPRSTTPLQALNLFNSSFLLEQAALLATKANNVTTAYELVYQRQPTQDELTAAEAFVQQEGLPAFCRALLNSNEFLFLE